MEKTLKTLENTILHLVVFLVPVVILSSFTNAFTTPKLMVLVFGISAILLLKAIRSIMSGTLSAHIGIFDIPVLALACTYIASLIMRSPNKMEGLLLPGTATTIVTGIVVYFLVSQLSKEQKNIVKVSLITSGVLAAIMSMFALAGVFKSFTGLPAFMQDVAFSPLEGSIQAFIFFLALMPLIVNLIVSSKDAAMKALAGTSAAIIFFGLVIAGYNILPGKSTSPLMPSFSTSWQIAADAVKENPLFGVGPGNYLTAFNRYRPVNYNETNLWSVRFATGRDFYLTVMTETGLLGIAAIGLLLLSFFKIFRTIQKDRKMLFTSDQGSLVVLLILFLLFPASVANVVLLFILLGFVSTTHRFNYEPKGTEWLFKLPVYAVYVPMIVFVLILGYFSSKILVAESQYKSALTAVSKNDGRTAYDGLRAAITTNPYVDRYRASYAQVNLALANNIAQKQDITDQDRQTIATLIDQAIREGKATVVLNPTRAGNWELLSNIYRTLIPLAKGSDQFAVQTAQRAAVLDPTNPNTRIYLGGIHYLLKDYQGAIEHFRMAANLKPDLPNAYYNLSAAYRENKDIDRAVSAMQVVVNLLEQAENKNQNDIDLAKKELENLQSQKPSQPAQGENLTVPEQTGNELDPKLDLPEDANPPEAPEEAQQSPSPSPTGSPEASPTATPES